jgi:pimeloyl-ACP methyl ester carboxylesterase
MSSISYVPKRAPRYERRLLRGIDTHLTWWGAGNEPPIVCLHGWVDTGATFQFLVDALGRERTIVAPDWRGFGRSQWQETPYWFPDYLADLDTLLNMVSPSHPVTLIGHSMGGNVACLYAGIRPERVSHLINLEGLGSQNVPPELAPARYRQWLDELAQMPSFSIFDSIERFSDVLRRKNRRLTAERADFIAHCWSRTLPDGRYTVNADPAHKWLNPVGYRRADAEACWREVTARVLCVFGEDSAELASFKAGAVLDYYRAQFPTAQLEMLSDAGHMMHHEQPEKVAALIDAFLGN